MIDVAYSIGVRGIGDVVAKLTEDNRLAFIKALKYRRMRNLACSQLGTACLPRIRFEQERRLVSG